MCFKKSSLKKKKSSLQQEDYRKKSPVKEVFGVIYVGNGKNLIYNNGSRNIRG